MRKFKNRHYKPKNKLISPETEEEKVSNRIIEGRSEDEPEGSSEEHSEGHSYESSEEKIVEKKFDIKLFMIVNISITLELQSVRSQNVHRSKANETRPLERD
jgi:hypothetical protein